MRQLYTRWGKAVDAGHILQEYPRPLLRRDSYINLNGYWEYAITKSFQKPATYAGRILVPFSPESALSGVGRQLQPEEYLWYRRDLPVDREKIKNGLRLRLNFGAVDQACRVYINGKEAAGHEGGYLPFSADITDFLLPAGAGTAIETETAEKAGESEKNVTGGSTGRPAAVNELTVVVKDLSDTSYHARGKQKLKRGGMFYTAQSGIWQTVWMEYVPEHFIEEVIAEADPDQEKVRILVRANAEAPVEIQVTEPQIDPDVPGACQTVGERKIIAAGTGKSNAYITLALPDVKAWTCEQPYLYHLKINMEKDSAESYFAVRRFSVEPDAEGIPRICLNGKIQFQKGVLDQGYWPDGLYTAPADAAFVFDILEMKKLGFNMIRKHIKIEPQRWYYHCDRLGMIVWQDMVNGGTYYRHWFVTYAATLISWRGWTIRDVYTRLLSRKHKEGRLEFVREMKETIRHLKGHPCIAAWVLFNEGWGQFQTKDMTRIARSCDQTRLIDQASGWFDQKGGDLLSLHNYFFKLHVVPEKERAAALSEFGGYSLQVPGHSACEELYGYGTFKEKEKLNAAYRKREQEVEALIPKGLCASVYTQLSDVEEEVNGIFTYDREIRKIEP